MPDRTLVVFTYRPKQEIMTEGGSQAWSLNASNARRCKYIVCTRNRYFSDASPEDQAAATEGHGAAFMVGRITVVEPAPEDPTRFIVRFSEYASLDARHPDVWKGARNPVWYVDDLKELGIEPDTLTWHPTARETEDVADLASNPYFERFAAPLGHIILEFNYLEVDAGKVIARMLLQDDFTASVFTAVPFSTKLKLIRDLAVVKVQDENLKLEIKAIIEKAEKLNGERNRFVHAEYMPEIGPSDEVVRMRYRKLKDGSNVFNSATARSLSTQIPVLDISKLETLGREIHQLAYQMRSFAERYYDHSVGHIR